MKLVIQFFSEKDGTRSEPFSGSPAELLDLFEQMELSLQKEADTFIDRVSKLDPDDPEQVYEGSYDNFAASMYSARDAAFAQLESFLDSHVLVILHQYSDDADDMRVSRIPILKREKFIHFLTQKCKENAQ